MLGEKEKGNLTWPGSLMYFASGLVCRNLHSTSGTGVQNHLDTNAMHFFGSKRRQTLEHRIQARVCRGPEAVFLHCEASQIIITRIIMCTMR